MRGTLVLPAAFLAMAGGARADEHAPRVLSPHNADGYSMKTFAQYPRWRDLKGDAKVYEIYSYLADTRTGLFPLGTPGWEARNEGEPWELFGVRDPVKMVNVYPIGHCGTMGPTMAGIMKDMGIGPSRTVMLPGNHHCLAEVFYDGKWHYLDLDLRGVFRRRNGTLASMEDCQKELELFTGSDAPLFFPPGYLRLCFWDPRIPKANAPLFFPLDPLGGLKDDYVNTSIAYRYGFPPSGHTMDYVLRRGETFTRWWKPQGGRWFHHPSYAADPYLRTILEKEPRGLKCKHVDYSIHTQGNGRYVYKPNLTSKSSDFEDGVYDSKNVEPGESGLTLKQAGEGFAIFEVRTPYIIAPIVGDLDRTDDDKEASVVTVDATGVSLSISLDNGITWKEIGEARGAHDLTPWVRGAYGYLLRTAFKGEPGKAVVRSLDMTTWVQVHAASLPALRKGKNEMQYVTGDHYGLPTRVVEIRPDSLDKEDFLKYCSEPPADFDPKRKTCRIKGAFTARVDAPPGHTIAWFSAGAAFSVLLGEAAPKSKGTISYALDSPKDFKQLINTEGGTPPDHSSWHYNSDVEMKLDAPAKTLFVRYSGDPGVNNIRLYAHCVADAPRASSPVEITHAWKEKGVLKTKSVTLAKPGSYVVEAEDDPSDEYVEMSISSGVR